MEDMKLEKAYWKLKMLSKVESAKVRRKQLLQTSTSESLQFSTKSSDEIPINISAIISFAFSVEILAKISAKFSFHTL